MSHDLTTEANRITKKYLERFPNQSSLSLARLLYSENPLMFLSVEHARCKVRVLRGAHGKKLRSQIKDRRFFGTGMILPAGEEPEYKPIILPKKNNRILFMSDIHLPFHDLQSVQIALYDAKDKDCNTVILGGDIVDFYNLSVFDKTPHKSTFQKEREMFWQLIDDINEILPDAEIIWIEGNHEYRFTRYLIGKSAELYGINEFTMPEVFHLGQIDVKYIDRKQYIKAGSLNILHGHEFGNSITSPVNPARGFYLKAKDSAVFGHLHQSSEHSEADLRGNVKSCYSVGCLCYLHPEYRPLNKWNTGFALVEINDNGFMVKNKKIIGGKIQ